ncbi:MAG: hypothetical protein AAF623_02540 [Planctomycetota bacterium]
MESGDSAKINMFQAGILSMYVNSKYLFFLVICFAVGTVWVMAGKKDSHKSVELTSYESITGNLIAEPHTGSTGNTRIHDNWQMNGSMMNHHSNSRRIDVPGSVSMEQQPIARVQMTQPISEGESVRSFIDIGPGEIIPLEDSFTDFTAQQDQVEQTLEQNGLRQATAYMENPPEMEQQAPVTIDRLPGSAMSERIAEVGLPKEIIQADNVRISRDIVPLQMALPRHVEIQAARRIEYGKTLARRGAAFAANEEFISALRIVAEAIDAQSGGNDYSKALSLAGLALRESGDFIPRNSQVAFDVRNIIEGHRCRAVSVEEASTMTASSALARYLEFAENYFDIAGGRTVVAAEALFCLGKLHRLRSEQNNVPGNSQQFQSIVYHRAAMLADPQHHRSANELGVLMARNGRTEEAKELLKKSLIVDRSPLVWQNLARIHNRLGEDNFAKLATKESRLAMNSNIPSGQNSMIQWMAPGTFNQTGIMEFDSQMNSSTRVASNANQIRRIPQPERKASAEEPSANQEPKQDDSKWQQFNSYLKNLF